MFKANFILKNHIVYLFMLCVLISTKNHAAVLSQSCVSSNVENLNIDYSYGQIDRAIPIASVSKIFTSVFVASQKNLNDQLKTQVFIQKLENGMANIHLSGDFDPSFDKISLYAIFSQLNDLSVYRINNFSFDEKFKFLPNVQSKDGFVIYGKKIKPILIRDEIDFPKAELVTELLKQYKNYILDLNKSNLNKNVQLEINRITYVKSDLFVQAKENFKLKLEFKSPPIHQLLKAMNWSSNNYYANLFIYSLGGVEKLQIFFKNQKMSANFKFYNGSGQNHALAEDIKKGNLKIYNQASCRDVLIALKKLNELFTQQGLNITDVLPVVGVDKKSTVGKPLYTFELSSGAVAAKTGTVGTNVALSGVINTEYGLNFFMINVESEAIKKDAQGKITYDEKMEMKSREIIGDELKKILESRTHIKPFNYLNSKNPILNSDENYGEFTN